ncbi:response regulator [Paenibacillus solisilvae]|uniref:Response regulator n=1 Tax=Paenibacillus solisilvae TaxID=2486751 RepID=A0ABW0W791_9BACL
MHQVVIVEDEVLARTHLLELIAWEDHGYRICGVFDSGLTAMKQLQRLQPDIIISDVYMPGMDGIELSSQLKTAQLAAKLIMLSSYDSYDYVRETFSNGAVDYLLKDRLNTETLLRALDKARSGIKRTEGRQLHAEGVEKGPFMLRTYTDVTKRFIARNWLLGIEQDEDHAEEQLKGLELDFDRHAVVVLSLQVSNADMLMNRFSDKEKSMWVQSLLNLHEQNLAGTMVHIDQSRFAILYPVEINRSEQKVGEEVQQYTNRLSKLLEKFMNVKLICGVSSPCHDVRRLAQAFLSASGQIQPSAASEGPLPPGDGGDEHLLMIGIREEQELLTALVSMDVQAAESLIRNLYKKVSLDDPVYKANAAALSSELVALARKTSRQLGDRADSRMQLQAPLHIPDITGEGQHAGMLEEAMVKLYIELIEGIANIQMQGASPYVRKAISCIRTRYREELSLGEVAGHIGIHPVYLSRLFRQEMAIPFVEYLNKVRIEAAKTMISSGMKIKDIYEQVGFNNYNYFFKVFKAQEGLTPAEYEKRKNSCSDEAR